MKLVAYARASTEDQQITLADQEEKLRQYAALYDHEIVELLVGSESAKSLKRDEFQRALQLLREDKADGLLILKIDRLARDVGDGQQLLREYFGVDSKYGKHLFSVIDYVDTRTANGLLLFNLQLVIAAWERQTIAERTKAALDYKRKSKLRVGEVSYGYTLADDGKSLIENDDEQRGISLMRQLREEGWTYQAIADELTKQEFPTKKGAPWHPNSVARILKRAEQ